MMEPVLLAAVGLLALGFVVLGVKYVRLKQTAAGHAASARALDTDLSRARDERDDELDRILNALTDAFLLIEPGGTIVFANLAARELMPGSAISNRAFEEVILDGRLSGPIRKALDTGEKISELVVLSQQNSPLGVEDRRGVNAWHVDAGPTDLGSLGSITRVIIRDVTGEYQAEQVRKDFVANASHELRTPLAIINGYLETLLEDGMLADVASARRFLGTMQKHGGRLERIVEDMLVISKLESGEAASLKIEPFPLLPCVQDVLERLESMIGAHGARISLKIEKEDLGILGDRFYWNQIFFNLVENALKQNPATPIEIVISGKLLEDGRLETSVSDNGVGIPSSDLPYIFKRFYRVEKHHSQDEIKGTGLGLSIVKRAVEAHHGTIEVTSTPGARTRFRIILPKERVA